MNAETLSMAKVTSHSIIFHSYSEKLQNPIIHAVYHAPCNALPYISHLSWIIRLTLLSCHHATLRSTISTVFTLPPLNQRSPIVVQLFHSPLRTRTRHPAPHPPTHSLPSTSALAILYLNDLLTIPEDKELHTHNGIHGENTGSAKEKRRRESNPCFSITPFGVRPAMQAVWWV